MSYYQDGYDAGYQDGLDDKWSFTEKMQTFIGMFIDTVLRVSKAEDEWRDGYEEGYKDGKEVREKD